MGGLFIFTRLHFSAKQEFFFLPGAGRNWCLLYGIDKLHSIVYSLAQFKTYEGDGGKDIDVNE